MLTSSDQPGPPDEWLALSDAERAYVLRRAREFGSGDMQPVVVEAVTKPAEPPPVSNIAPATPPAAPTLVDTMELADALDPNDRMRLIARLWESLPAKNRAAIVAFGLENMRYPENGEDAARNATPIDTIGPTIWDALFDRTHISELYSAPRRFDLATIFVITAAYSLLLAAMKALDQDPITMVVVSAVVSIVGVCQAFFYHDANPRGVSVVSGAIAQSIILGLITIVAPRWFGVPPFVVVVIFGLAGGAIAGYLAGTLVAGVFLVADLLRKRFQNRSTTESDDANAFDAD